MSVKRELEAIDNIADEVNEAKRERIFLESSCKSLRAKIDKCKRESIRINQENEIASKNLQHLNQHNAMAEQMLLNSRNANSSMQTMNSNLKKDMLLQQIKKENFIKHSRAEIRLYEEAVQQLKKKFESTPLAIECNALTQEMKILTVRYEKSERTLGKLKDNFKAFKKFKKQCDQRLTVKFAEHVVSWPIKMQQANMLRMSIASKQAEIESLTNKKISLQVEIEELTKRDVDGLMAINSKIDNMSKTSLVLPDLKGLNWTSQLQMGCDVIQNLFLHISSNLGTSANFPRGLESLLPTEPALKGSNDTNKDTQIVKTHSAKLNNSITTNRQTNLAVQLKVGVKPTTVDKEKPIKKSPKEQPKKVVMLKSISVTPEQTVEIFKKPNLVFRLPEDVLIPIQEVDENFTSDPKENKDGEEHELIDKTAEKLEHYDDAVAQQEDEVIEDPDITANETIETQSGRASQVKSIPQSPKSQAVSQYETPLSRAVLTNETVTTKDGYSQENAGSAKDLQEALYKKFGITASPQFVYSMKKAQTMQSSEENIETANETEVERSKFFMQESDSKVMTAQELFRTNPKVDAPGQELKRREVDDEKIVKSLPRPTEAIVEEDNNRGKDLKDQQSIDNDKENDVNLPPSSIGITQEPLSIGQTMASTMDNGRDDYMSGEDGEYDFSRYLDTGNDYLLSPKDDNDLSLTAMEKNIKNASNIFGFGGTKPSLFGGFAEPKPPEHGAAAASGFTFNFGDNNDDGKKKKNSFLSLFH